MEVRDREEFTSRMQNLDEEEKAIVVKTISNEMLIEELKSRLMDATNRINKIKDVFKMQEII